MPIQLDDIDSIVNSVPVRLGPKFFSSILTGGGDKRAGLISERLRPGRYAVGESSTSLSQSGVDTKSKSSGSGVTTHVVPLAPLASYSLRGKAGAGLSLLLPDLANSYDITAGRAKLAMNARLSMTPQSILLYEDENTEPKTRNLNVLYRMELTVLTPGSTSTSAVIRENAPPAGSLEEFVMLDWSYAPLDDVEALIAKATRHFAPNSSGVFVDVDELAEWMGNYDVYDNICQLANVWDGPAMGDLICTHVQELFALPVAPNNDRLNVLAAQLRHLETYNVSLTAYRLIYNQLNTTCAPDVALLLAKQNLNLLMSHSLDVLNAMKPQLIVPGPGQHGTQPVVAPHFSTQQRAAVGTDEPLTLVQAGAGTGKSTVILGRIENLISRGVAPSDITVLSFTNAAADNITDRVARAFPTRNDNVTSMTIARMIHDIYTLNHPGHELSSMDTILNSLDIFYPKNDMARAFRKHLMDVAKNQAGATTALNAFVEMYHDSVVAVLSTIGQTCLELEIIFVYQRIDTMTEPPHVRSQYLIVDEVQDNSIFEFIYMLKYVAKHKENLFLVGDASQTLYEFRAANPRALNALEGSAVFATYQLNTNYRSNQEVLDFANVHLAEIGANASAQLRLQANSLVMPTPDSFQEKVQLRYIWAKTDKEFTGDYPAYLRTITGEYIDACLARGEQVAFLMFSRAMATTTVATLEELYPTKKVISLVSAKSFSSTVFSQCIKMYWNDIMQVPDVKSAPFAVTQTVTANIDRLTQNGTKALPSVTKMMTEWWLSNNASINGWVALVKNNSMKRSDFFDLLQRNLLDYEIRNNSIRQSLMSQKNRERKENNLASRADLIVSTIHGAKGLEFANVVVVHKYSSPMTESEKRMYYVALTRAMKTEFVLSHGTVKKARIETDYQLIVDALAVREKRAAMIASGMTPDMVDSAMNAGNNTIDDNDEAGAALALMTVPASQPSPAAQDEAVHGPVALTKPNTANAQAVSQSEEFVPGATASDSAFTDCAAPALPVGEEVGVVAPVAGTTNADATAGTNQQD